MSLPDRPDAHHKAQAARGYAGLVRMGHHAGVAECRAFDCILVGERGTKQQPTRLGELEPRIEAFGELVGVPPERIDEVAVTVFEPSSDVI